MDRYSFIAADFHRLLSAGLPAHGPVTKIRGYVERNNGIIRQHCKRYARLTQAFSKKLENHVYAFALHTMYHNFVKISGAHRMTPAQAAEVDSRLWEVSDKIAMIEEWEASGGSS